MARAPTTRDGIPRPIFTVPDDHDRARPTVADALASGRARSDDALSASRALALAFAAGGGTRYLDAWIATVSAPLAAEPDHRPGVLAARIENILRSWRTLAETPAFPGLTPDVAALIEGGIGRHAGALAARVPSAGASHAEATHALLVAGLAFDGAEGLAERAIAELDRGLAAGAWPDGGHRAGTIDEHRRALRRYLAAVENARRFALHLPAGFLDRVGAVCDFVLHTSAVDGETGRMTGSHDLRLAGEIMVRDDLRWAGTEGRDGRPPTQRNPSFRYVGVHVQRTGWGAGATPFADERRLLLDESTLGASISTRIGEMLIAPEAEDDGAFVTRTGRWRINVLVAASERRRRQLALLPGGAWLLVDHGGPDDTVTYLSPGTEMAVAVNRGSWVLRGQAADIVMAGSARPVTTSAGDGVAIAAPRVHADAIVALIVPHVTPPAAPAELEVLQARPDLVDCRVGGRAVRWRLAAV
jgi:hypothetical protein